MEEPHRGQFIGVVEGIRFRVQVSGGSGVSWQVASGFCERVAVSENGDSPHFQVSGVRFQVSGARFLRMVRAV
jgi:hypothetical protein